MLLLDEEATDRCEIVFHCCKMWKMACMKEKGKLSVLFFISWKLLVFKKLTQVVNANRLKGALILISDK